MPLVRTPRSVASSDHSDEVELLKKAGLIKASDGIEGHFLGIAKEVGLGPREILSRIAILMDGSDTDAVKLAAAKLGLQLYMHPAFVNNKNDPHKISPTINFQINVPSGAQTQMDLAGILQPEVPKGSAQQVVDYYRNNPEEKVFEPFGASDSEE